MSIDFPKRNVQNIVYGPNEVQIVFDLPDAIQNST